MTDQELDQMEREAAAAVPQHDPQDVETVARLLSGAFDYDITDRDGAAWESFKGDSAMLLDALQAKGWKITARPKPDAWNGAAVNYHDDADICPRNGE